MHQRAVGCNRLLGGNVEACNDGWLVIQCTGRIDLLSQAVDCQFEMMPFSPHSGHCHRIRSSGQTRYSMIPEHGRRPKRRRHRIGAIASVRRFELPVSVVAAATILV